jgi:trehalose 6-phosphate synthase
MEGTMKPVDRIRGALSRAAVRTQQRSSGPPRTTREDLVAWARAHLHDRKLVVVSNREPYSHVHAGQRVNVVRNAGGLTVALDAVVQALGGVWVATGSGDADRENSDERGRVACPPDQPRYTLRRLWLSEQDHAQYYSGFSNGALWPLCHIAYVRPRFRLEDWERYRDVNQRFAEAVLDEVGTEPSLVFLQDYHLSLVARTLKQTRPDLQVAMFWHIPWPNPEVFRILPWKEDVLEGLLANDVVGFHTRAHALNFLDSVAATLEAQVDRERLTVLRNGHRTWVRDFPISVPADEIAALAERPETARAERRIRSRLALEDCRVGLGVDRLDYTKGIPERLEALETLFERHPEWIGKVAFIQIGVPSRIELREYRDVQTRARGITRRINRRFPRAHGPTVILIERNVDFDDLVPYYRLADFCAVTSLHDGMNLVAKEYIAASPDLDGALILSPFTGASRELERAFIASPYDREGMAESYHAALSETPESRHERMQALRETVLRRNIFDWAVEVLDAVEAFKLRTPAPTPVGASDGDGPPQGE